jgi:hypothetical protein
MLRQFISPLLQQALQAIAKSDSVSPAQIKPFQPVQINVSKHPILVPFLIWAQ